MVEVTPTAKKYTILFKPKDRRVDKTTDKVELLRSALGLSDQATKNVFEPQRMAKAGKKRAEKDKQTISDINKYRAPVLILRLTPEQANKLRHDPNIAAVDEDRMQTMHLAARPDPGEPVFVETIPWGISKVNAPAAWELDKGRKGKGVRIGIIDGGIDTEHPDLKDNIKGFELIEGSDQFGNDHGSHVAGISSALSNSVGVVGVAPEGWLYNIRIFNGGSASISDSVEAVEFAIDIGCNVINMSFGGGTHNSSFEAAVRDAFLADTVPVASAGNGNWDNSGSVRNYPSGYDFVLEVSAITQNNQKASFSNYGTTTDFAAPGVDIYSTIVDERYDFKSGTSMASPHVAGVVALGFCNYRKTPCLESIYGNNSNANTVVNAMIDTADTLGQFTHPDKHFYLGNGIPNAEAMVKRLLDIRD